MTDLRQAAKLALEALEMNLPIIEDFGGKEELEQQHKAINAVYEALRRAKAEDAMDKMAENARELGLDYEPVTCPPGTFSFGYERPTVKFSGHEPWCASLNQTLAVMPPRPAPCDCKTNKDYARGYVAGMDSKLFASDTSQERVDKAEEQRHEPVAMRWDFDGYGYRYIDSGSGSNWQTRVKDAEPLYDRPQQCPNCASLMEQNTELDKKLAEWVGLTEEEIDECFAITPDLYLTRHIAQRLEAKLKEKNR